MWARPTASVGANRVFVCGLKGTLKTTRAGEFLKIRAPFLDRFWGQVKENELPGPVPNSATLQIDFPLHLRCWTD